MSASKMCAACMSGGGSKLSWIPTAGLLVFIGFHQWALRKPLNVLGITGNYEVMAPGPRGYTRDEQYRDCERYLRLVERRLLDGKGPDYRQELEELLFCFIATCSGILELVSSFLFGEAVSVLNDDDGRADLELNSKLKYTDGGRHSNFIRC